MLRPTSGDGNSILDSRTDIELRRMADQARRNAELEQQRSIANSPEARIRIWEQRHQLSLPINPEHRLIDVIADATALTRAQVLEELRMRMEGRPFLRGAETGP